jgi:hypothetical protein
MYKSQNTMMNHYVNFLPKNVSAHPTNVSLYRSFADVTFVGDIGKSS